VDFLLVIVFCRIDVHFVVLPVHQLRSVGYTLNLFLSCTCDTSHKGYFPWPLSTWQIVGLFFIILNYFLMKQMWCPTLVIEF
jgi:hypothetical protein